MSTPLYKYQEEILKRLKSMDSERLEGLYLTSGRCHSKSMMMKAILDEYKRSLDRFTLNQFIEGGFVIPLLNYKCLEKLLVNYKLNKLGIVELGEYQ